MNKIVVVVGALLVIAAVGGGSFWAGATLGSQLFGGPGRLSLEMGGEAGQFQNRLEMMGTPQPGAEGAQYRGGGMGTIAAIEGDSLIVTTEEGEIRVQTTETTLIEKSLTVGIADLAVGEQVMVAGSRNDDGSITARSIRASTTP